MPIRSLMYVSAACIAEPDASDVVNGIVTDAKMRNETLDITGALLFTRRHFVQALEGPRPSVDSLMACIARDRRHRDVTIVSDRSVTARRFAAWSMAYSGPSQFAARQVGDLLSSDAFDRPQAAERLLWIMREFIGTRQ